MYFGRKQIVAETVLGSDASSISLSVSNLGGTDLEVYLIGRTTRSSEVDVLGLRFNGDSGSNYTSAAFNCFATGSPSGISNDGVSLDNLRGIICPAALSPANYDCGTRISIPAYKSTAQNKTAAWEGFDARDTAAGDQEYGAGGGMWLNTAAITSIAVVSDNGADLASGFVLRAHAR